MGTRHTSARKRPARHLGPALCLLMLAGCEGMMGRSGFEGDPLTAGPPMPRTSPNNQTAGTGQTAGIAATTQPSPLPGLPAPASTTSPAALTGGGANPTLDPGRDLRIGTGLGYQPPVSAPGAVPNATSPSGAVLRTPQLLNDGTLQQTGSVQPPNGAGTSITPGGSVVDSYQQLQEALNARGVTWRRLETLGDSSEWKFTCSVPGAQNPNLRHTYEARGSTDLGAIRAALDQIDRDRLKR